MAGLVKELLIYRLPFKRPREPGESPLKILLGPLNEYQARNFLAPEDSFAKEAGDCLN